MNKFVSFIAEENLSKKPVIESLKHQLRDKVRTWVPFY